MQARSTEVVSVGVELKAPTETRFLQYIKDVLFLQIQKSEAVWYRASVSHRVFSVASAGHVTEICCAHCDSPALSPVEKTKKERKGSHRNPTRIIPFYFSGYKVFFFFRAD